MNNHVYDGIFFINHALNLNVSNLSVFNSKERFAQTLDTLRSIDEKCPDNLKIVIDNSPMTSSENYVRTISEWPNTLYKYMGGDERISMYSIYGQRSLAESYSFMLFFKWFHEQNYKSKRIYKLSGRYQLSDNFVLNDPSHKDAFVFAKALDSWMTKEHQEHTGMKKQYPQRFWHMDFNLFETFAKENNNIFADCSRYDVDVEHAYYNNLHKYNVIEVPKVGLKGYIAPTGEFIDE